MRKALTMLGAIAALALGSLFAAAPANATVTCNPYVVATRPTSYPAISATSSYFYNCLTNTTADNDKRDAVEAQLHGLPAKVTEYLAARGAKFYLFKDNVDAAAYGWQIGPGFGALTIQFGSDPKTAILTEVDNVFDPPEVLSNKMLKFITAHEASHHIDYIWRNTPSPASDMLSSTQRFMDLYGHDRFLLNYVWNGVTAPTARAACGSSGVFYQIRDPSTNGFICSGTNGQGTTLNPGYTGTNAQIADSVFNYYLPRKDFRSVIASNPVVAGQIYSIKFTNADLPGGSVTVSYTAVAGDNNQSVRNQLVSLISGNSNLSSKGITATADPFEPTLILISAATAKITYIAQSASGSGLMLLKNAGISEFFAEKFATQVAAGNVPTYATTDGGLTRQTAAVDKFLQSAFSCSGTYMSVLRATTNTPPVPPTDPTNPPSANCGNPLPAGYSFP